MVDVPHHVYKKGDKKPHTWQVVERGPSSKAARRLSLGAVYDETVEQHAPLADFLTHRRVRPGVHREERRPNPCRELGLT